LKTVYSMLYKDLLINVRKSLAASLIEIAKLISLKDATAEDQTFFVDAINHFLQDVDEVRHKLLPHLCGIVALFPDDKQQSLL